MVVLLFLLLSSPCVYNLSESSFLVGNQASLSVPSEYDASFHGKAFIMESGEDREVPRFRAALNVEPMQGRYMCYLSVLFGQVEVWSSKALSEFSPTSSCTVELTAAGELLLRDSSRRVGWRAGTFGQGVQVLL